MEDYELRAPCYEDELKELFSDAKKLAMESFSKVAVGDIQKKFLVELKEKLKNKLA